MAGGVASEAQETMAPWASFCAFLVHWQMAVSALHVRRQCQGQGPSACQRAGAILAEILPALILSFASALALPVAAATFHAFPVAATRKLTGVVPSHQMATGNRACAQ